MNAPESVQVNKPVKLIFIGGFLGSGKTTALAALAKGLIRRGKKVGIITNDQSENLVDTVIVREMLKELGVPVKEVVKGCFCCNFNELIDEMEKILAYDPDVMMGEPVGSCTDFVAAVANPIKIRYKDAFRFAPFCTMVDPDRVRELLLGEIHSDFPEEVAYLFQKQLEEADIIVLNKLDLISNPEADRLLLAIRNKFSDRRVIGVSSKRGDGMDPWLEDLLTSKPGANTVLSQIDYDRYARAEAVLGWLNAAVKLKAEKPFDSERFILDFAMRIREAFKSKHAAVGHLKLAVTAGGQSMWANVTDAEGETVMSDARLDLLTEGALIVNARVRIEPDDLETIVRHSIDDVSCEYGVEYEVIDLQCFSPAYPEPLHIIRESFLNDDGNRGKP